MTDVRAKGFFKRMPVDEALEILMRRITPLPAESVGLTDAAKRVLARDVKAKINCPPFSRSAMDGYALKGENSFGASQTNPIYFKVIGEVSAGHPPVKQVAKFEAVKITTGGEIPGSADAVLMVEYTRDRGGEIEVVKAAAPGENVIIKGEDAKKGSVVLEKGHMLGPHDVGMLAAVGLDRVNVAKRPSVSIISTGDELVTPGEEIKAGKVYDVNAYLLSSLVSAAGGTADVQGIIKDDYAKLKAAIEKSIEYDVVIISGATSVGEKDFIPKIVGEAGEVLFHGVSMRPGAPTGAGIIGKSPVFMLPGNPVASIFAFETFVRPALQGMQGAALHNPYPQLEGPLSRKVASEMGRRDFVWVTIDKNGSVSPIRTTSSGIISSLQKAGGFVVVPENTEGIEKGKVVRVRLFRNQDFHPSF